MNIYKQMIILIFISLLLIGCLSPEGTTQLKTGSKIYITSINYFEIDGMPCIYYDGVHQGSIDCDWSKWNGTTDKKITTPYD